MCGKIIGDETRNEDIKYIVEIAPIVKKKSGNSTQVVWNWREKICKFYSKESRSNEK